MIMGNYFSDAAVRPDEMAAGIDPDLRPEPPIEPAVGVDHATVVPANYEDARRRDGDE
jgi:hypothetical protein